MKFPELRTPAEFAAEIGLPSKRHVYRWIEEHGCPAYRVGRAIYLNPVEVAQWLDRTRNAA